MVGVAALIVGFHLTNRACVLISAMNVWLGWLDLIVDHTNDITLDGL